MKLNERQKQTVEKLKGIDSGNDFFWDDKTGSAKFIKGRLSKPSKDEPETIARAFLEDNIGLLDVQEDLIESLEVSQIEKDKQGFSHIYFAQTLNGIPVYEGSTQVHINPAGEVVAYKDYRLAVLDVPLEPRIADQDALEIVLKDRGKESVAIMESKARLILFRDSEKETHLAWEIEWIGEGDLAASFHIVDAHSGSILLKHTRMRGVVSRLTYSAENSTDLRAKLVARNDESSTDQVAQAAHEHVETVYHYFYNSFGRDSYDGRGADLVSTVHFKQNYNNAYWTDWYKQMVYGDGDGHRFAPLALALDIVGHELTHAVSSRTARFVYAEEAGALDESFADFFGVMVTNEGEITDWEMGEGVYTPYRSGDALRDVSDPARYGQPDHMNDFMALEPWEQPDPDKNDNGYVHSNSGIPNKAAYLTVAGGTHHGIAVQGVGREKAEQIYYLAMTGYLSSATDSRWTFMQARYALLNACRQLHGDTGSEYAAVKNAWAAVGVGEPADTLGIVRKDTSPHLAIPDNETTGVESVLHIEEEGLLKDINIGMVIEHTYIGDLRVILTSPSGESVVLHDRQGGSSRDIIATYNLDSYPGLSAFAGDRVKGDWTLSVSDHAGVDTGKLMFWELEFSIEKVEKKELTKEASPNQQIPDNDLNGIESLIEIQESGRIVRLDIPVDISHPWIGDLRVLLVSPSGAEVTLHDRTGRSRHDIKRIYSTTSDEPMLALLGSEIQGIWRLKVVDTYSRDIGTLSSWGIHCVYE
jgi:bacillolysin